MRMSRILLLSGIVIFFSINGCICIPQKGGEANTRLSRVKFPPGFSISLYAVGVDGARSMVRGEKGALFVGTRSEGRVYALVDSDNDYRVDKKYVIASGLNSPNGVALKGGSLYVAEISRVLRFDNIEKRLDNPPEPAVVYDKFPAEEHHGWKYIAFGPDGMLYVPVGAPCNICKSENPIFDTITRMKPDGTGLEIYARGVRNTVGFDWHPDTKELWFTDNGRDWMGNNRPPDELNRAPGKGLHFGYPFCHGKDIVDPKLGSGKKCGDYVPPVQELGPHVAALGMKFYTGRQFPSKYRGRVFIAEHGSWNRTPPIGYRVTTVTLDGNRAEKYEVFAEGWLQGTKAWGRPVDIVMLPDGSLLVSDDRGGVIYRISYR